MDWKIVMKEAVYNKITTLMNNIKILNNGDEIGAWFFGGWSVKENTATLTLDDFNIPKQTVSSAEVDISPESMISTIKELGNGACNRIKAHWHIHPFGTGDTSWSGTDESKIKDFMEPAKGRKVFVFLLSSIDRIKARVVVNYECMNPMDNSRFWITQSFDDLPVECEGRTNDAMIAELKKMMEGKIERPVTVSNINDWKDRGTGFFKSDNIAELFKIDATSNEVSVVLNKGFYDYCLSVDTPFINECSEAVGIGDNIKLTFKLKAGEKPKHVKKALRKVLQDCEEDFVEVTDVEIYKEPSYIDYAMYGY